MNDAVFLVAPKQSFPLPVEVASLLSQHLASLGPEPVVDASRMKFVNAGPESDSDSGLEDIFKGSEGGA